MEARERFRIVVTVKGTHIVHRKSHNKIPKQVNSSHAKMWWVRFCMTITRQGAPMLAFLKGWKAFAQDNMLKERDTLILVLNAYSVLFFKVFLFQSSP